MTNNADIWQSVKTAVTVALSTLGAGVGTILDILPDVFGLIASIVAIALSIALIRVHLAKYNQIVLETEIIRAKLEEAKRRKDAGLPVRREEDQCD